MTDQDVKETFKKYPGVRASYIIKHIDGRSRGFGFVEFFTKEDTEKAIKMIEKTRVSIKGQIIQVKAFLAEDKLEAKKQNAKTSQKK
jgi:polyadenylate-binding protein